MRFNPKADISGVVARSMCLRTVRPVYDLRPVAAVLPIADEAETPQFQPCRTISSMCPGTWLSPLTMPARLVFR